MQKTVTRPDSGDDLSEDTTAYAESVAVRHGDHTRVHVSGMTSDEATPDVGEQTRDVLRKIRDAVGEHGGDMRDVVRVGVYVASPHLDGENFEAIHAARREFFEPAHYPASTLVEVSGLVREGRTIEIDADAVVPTGGWD